MTSLSLRSGYPLAQSFSLYTGWATITVPEVEPNNNYIVARVYLILSSIFVLSSDADCIGIAVIGDSGNISNEFTIIA